MDVDRVVVAMGRDERFHASARIGDGLAVTLGSPLPVVEGARQHEPDAHAARRLDDGLRVLVAVVVQVEKIHAGGRTVAQHLGESERRAQCDAVAIESLREGIEHAVAPAHEIEVVAEPAQQRLEGVAVGVHRPRQQCLAPKPHIAGLDGTRRADERDPAIGDRNRAVGHPTVGREGEVRQEPHVRTGLRQTAMMW